LFIAQAVVEIKQCDEPESMSVRKRELNPEAKEAKGDEEIVVNASARSPERSSSRRRPEAGTELEVKTSINRALGLERADALRNAS
jgi:hypothetical protein